MSHAADKENQWLANKENQWPRILESPLWACSESQAGVK
jgi:hypothetical protein